MSIKLFERPRPSRKANFASAIFIALFTFALIDYARLNKRCSRCEMTFMSPVFRETPFPTNTTYSLHEYFDASMDLSRHKQHPDNIFIFVPGSAASYKQVRSIGSEILGRCKSIDCRVYSMETNEEASAFDAASLHRQIDYLKQAIDHLQVTYKPIKISLIGHSMGGIVARQAGCMNNKIDEVVELAAPSRPPIPSIEMEHLFRQLLECNRTLKILPALSDIQIVNQKHQQHGIRVDSLSLSWSDPHHQAIVWSNSLMRALADYLVFGKQLEFASLTSQDLKPSQATKSLQSASHSCGDFGPFTGSIVTDHKLGSDFDVLKEEGKVEIAVIPGKYSDATVNSGRIKTCQHSYLTVISGSDYYIRKYCSKQGRANDQRQRFDEYFMNESPFKHLFDHPIHTNPSHFNQIEQQTFKQYLLPFAVYSNLHCWASVKFPDGTMVYPDGPFLSGPLGKYSITFFGDCKHKKLQLDITKTLLGWINRDKRGFLQQGLLLGLTRRMPLVYLLLAILMFIVHPVSLLLGFSCGSSLLVLFLDPEPADPFYRFSDDLFLLKPLCLISSVISILLPYPIGCLACLPCLVYAFIGSKKKRLKAAQIFFILAFELASGFGATLNAVRSKRLTAGRSIFLKLLPVAFNYSLAMHVEVFVLLPLATLFDIHLPIAAAIICVICARLANDHERNQVK